MKCRWSSASPNALRWPTYLDFGRSDVDRDAVSGIAELGEPRVAHSPIRNCVLDVVAGDEEEEAGLGLRRDRLRGEGLVRELGHVRALRLERDGDRNQRALCHIARCRCSAGAADEVQGGACGYVRKGDQCG